jgi:hypothetical protein
MYRYVCICLIDTQRMQRLTMCAHLLGLLCEPGCLVIPVLSYLLTSVNTAVNNIPACGCCCRA